MKVDVLVRCEGAHEEEEDRGMSKRAVDARRCRCTMQVTHSARPNLTNFMSTGIAMMSRPRLYRRGSSLE